MITFGRRLIVFKTVYPGLRHFKINLGIIFTLGLDVYDSEDNSSDGERDRDDDIDSDEELKVIWYLLSSR